MRAIPPKTFECAILSISFSPLALSQENTSAFLREPFLNFQGSPFNTPWYGSQLPNVRHHISPQVIAPWLHAKFSVQHHPSFKLDIIHVL
jgi:hypothetical protein